jgi:hypothetical protein
MMRKNNTGQQVIINRVYDIWKNKKRSLRKSHSEEFTALRNMGAGQLVVKTFEI